MTGERWKRVNEIFHGALEVEDSDRDGFVLRAAEGDAGLEAEVRELLAADGAAEGYLEAPGVAAVKAVAPFEPGDMLCDRFRIVRAVGEGGMGFVFEAFDLELAVTVALKVIHPAIAAEAGALARFQQEVRLARRITHPNVCRTFDIDREVKVVDGARRETVFLTMEFLEGETLAARLKRDGRLGLEEARAVAGQVASALGAAHALGIVHRDVKPANIVLFGARAVVMDFGLARLDAVRSGVEGTSLSRGNQLVGTLAYMAPEQMEGGAVSAATDVYAFGLVLFEMVTGERAFPSESLLSGIWQRMAGAMPSAKERVPGLPGEWERAIQGCLRREAAERFQSAAEAVAVLGGGKVVLPGRRWWAANQWWIAGVAVFLVGMALFVGGLRLKRAGTDAAVAPGALVYFAGIRNETGDPSLENVGELMRSQLEQSAQFNLVGRDVVVSTLAAMGRDPAARVDARAAREVALRDGAALVISGTVSLAGGKGLLRMEIEQPEADGPEKARHRWVSEERRLPVSTGGTITPEVSESVRGLGEWVRRQAGESAKGMVQLDRAPEDVTTDNWEALNQYARAQVLASRNENDGAVAALREAVRLDPEFALAYGRLGDLLTARMEMKDGYEAYDRALSAGMARRLSRRERDRIKGMYAYDTGDYQTADAAFRDWEEFYENDPLAWAYREGVLRDLGHPEEAIASLRRVLELRPNAKAPLWNLVSSLLLVGRYDEAARAIERLRAAGYTDLANLLDGERLFLLKKPEEAQHVFAGLSGARDREVRQWSLALVARAQAERAAYGEARTTLDRAVEAADLAGERGPRAERLLDRAWVRARLGDLGGALADLDRALVLQATPQTQLAVCRVLGEGLRRSSSARERGQVVAALEKLERSLPVGGVGQISELVRWRVRGEVKLAHGDWQGAVDDFRTAVNLDAPSHSKEYLAEALEALAEREHTGKARALTEEALSAYGVVALHPATVWAAPLDVPPGFYADQLGRYRELAARGGSAGVDLKTAPGARLTRQSFGVGDTELLSAL